MAKKKTYAVNWEDEQAVSFVVDGVTYASLNDIPDKRDKRKLQAMMSAASAPDFDQKEWEQINKESNQAQNIILWVFGGVAALMLLIALLASVSNIQKVAHEKSAPAVVVEMVRRPEYDDDGSGRVVGETYFPVVRFTASDGKRREVQLSEGSFPPAYEVGDEVTVRYNPEKPIEARIDSAGSTALMWILPGITGILGLGFGGAVFAVRWLIRQ